MNPETAMNLNRTIVIDHFEKLHKNVVDNGFKKTECVYNMDEN
jgi:hypothetical protein